MWADVRPARGVCGLGREEAVVDNSVNSDLHGGFLDGGHHEGYHGLCTGHGHFLIDFLYVMQ